jgi:hypothetical protein
MALLAEEIVEEWLNRQGYFTIRGVKLGVHEIDLLAVKLKADGGAECRHVEVQASSRPVSYISRVPKELQLTGRAANSAAKRSKTDLKKGVEEWIEKKFRKPDKLQLMQSLYSGPWSSELVINQVKSEKDEVSLIEGHDVKILWLADIVRELLATKRFQIVAAAGSDILDLIRIGTVLSKREDSIAGKPSNLEEAIARADARLVKD